MSVRRVLAIVVFVLLAVRATISTLSLLPFDAAAMREAMTVYPDGAFWPEYPAFLRDVAAVTRPGDVIAIAVPAINWDHDYSYAYYRASYFLAGREVLPLMTPKNATVPANLARARYAAVWRTRVVGRWHLVFSAHGGVLVVR